MEDGTRKLTITLSLETTRRIGAIELPATRVEFAFQDYDQTRIDEFIADFDLHFRRGGG